MIETGRSRHAPADGEGGADFPFLVESEGKGGASFEALLDRVAAQKDFFSERLHRHGVILFRGFTVETPEQFATIVEALSPGRRLGEYRGGASPRSSLSAGALPVYNSTEYPPHVPLSLHNELSYSDAYPDRIYFFCM